LLPPLDNLTAAERKVPPAMNRTKTIGSDKTDGSAKLLIEKRSDRAISANSG
jgi:hypothetical protein